MELFTWSEECSVGIPELDAQHRQLLEVLAELVKSTKSGESAAFAPIALERLEKYGSRHLLREEMVLRVRGYPHYLEHKAEHDVYRQKFLALQANLARRDLAIRVVNFLTEWWKSHIMISDQEYARYFRGRPTAP
jgi:hemerythrin